MSDEKILRPKFGDPKIMLDRSEPIQQCEHKYLFVRRRARLVVCRVCGQPTDPFHVLANLVREWEWATHHAQQADELSAKIEVLKVEEHRLKARVRNGYKNAPEPKSKLFFDELIRRLANVETMHDLWNVDAWERGFTWLDEQQRAAEKEARIAARRRIEDSRRIRGRNVRLVDKKDEANK